MPLVGRRVRTPSPFAWTRGCDSLMIELQRRSWRISLGGHARATNASLRRREDRMDTLWHTLFTRRSVLRSAATGLAAAATLPLAVAGPAKASNYRGIVGDIKPRATDS